MQNYLGDIIYNYRQKLGQTQDEFGARYGVSGPAIFKFEKSFVRPSLELWLLMAADASVSERKAVLLWVKSRLPEAYSEYIELQGASEAIPRKSNKPRPPVSSALVKAVSRVELIGQLEESNVPDELAALVKDDELWALYKPTGGEIARVFEIFAPLGRGTVPLYREALSLLRSFLGTNS